VHVQAPPPPIGGMIHSWQAARSDVITAGQVCDKIISIQHDIMHIHTEYKLTFNSTNMWRGKIQYPREKGVLAVCMSD
jgi:hypothetical protein